MPRLTPSKKEVISESQVQDVLNAWDFLEFSNSYKTATYNTYFTPDIVNQQLQNINMNPTQSTIDDITNALNSPKSSQDILRAYAEGFENTNMYYKRLLRYLPDMANFNMTFDPINIEKDSEFNSKAFKDDLKVLDDFCNKFDIKQEFQTVLRQMFRQGSYFCILRTDDESCYTLQELPADFCKITGRHSRGLLFDFNMQWFITNYGVDINMYPKVFKKMYKDVVNKISTQYDPAKSLDHRTSTYVYWHQTSPDEGFWAFKVSPEIATEIPFYSSLFPNLNTQEIVKKLQKDKYFIEASKLLVGIVGFKKDTKSGQVANQINMTPDVLGKFLGVARKGLNKQIGLVALPVEDIKSVDFDVSSDNMEVTNMETISKAAVNSGEALYATEKLNAHQSKLASAIDANIVFALYPMFESFVEFYVNRLTKKYKFRVKFNDVNIPDNINSRMEQFKSMVGLGLVDVQLAARVCDMNAFEFSRSLSLTKTLGIEDKVIQLIKPTVGGNTKGSIGNVTGSVGRPAKLDSDNDSTTASWDSDSNALKE